MTLDASKLRLFGLFLDPLFCYQTNLPRLTPSSFSTLGTSTSLYKTCIDTIYRSLLLMCVLLARNNPTKSEEEELTRKDLTSVINSNFNGTKLTKIIIHGFGHSAHEAWVQDMKKELLDHVSISQKKTSSP